MTRNIMPLAIKVFYEGTSEESPYVAYSSEMELCAGGKTSDEAKRNLVNVIEEVLDYKSDDGTLDAYLLELGFIKSKDKNYISPELSFINVQVAASIQYE